MTNTSLLKFCQVIAETSEKSLTDEEMGYAVSKWFEGYSAASIGQSIVITRDIEQKESHKKKN